MVNSSLKKAWALKKKKACSDFLSYNLSIFTYFFPHIMIWFQKFLHSMRKKSFFCPPKEKKTNLESEKNWCSFIFTHKKQQIKSTFFFLFDVNASNSLPSVHCIDVIQSKILTSFLVSWLINITLTAFYWSLPGNTKPSVKITYYLTSGLVFPGKDRKSG